MALVNGKGAIIGSDGKEYYIGPGEDLRGANLTGAYLHRANLSRVDFYRADLYNADLTEANLSGSYFVGADLRGADLRGADLSRCHLYGADFRGAKVDAHHVPLIEAAAREIVSSLEVNGRTPNPHRGRTPNHHRTGILSEDYPMDPYNKDLDKAFDPYDRYWRTGNPGQGSRRGPGGYKY